MGFISAMFDSSNGAGFKGSGVTGPNVAGPQVVAPSLGTANLAAPVNSGQANMAVQQSQNGIGQQQQFLNALQAQGGLQNQFNVFNQQQALAGQLQGIASGQGPNPAQAMLNNATGQNVANQAALMAGQRGAGANVGLIARQAAQQGAATQQQAAGQAAAMQAQQSLGALGQLQGQQANLANLANTQVSQQAQGLQGLNSLNQAQQGALLGQINNQNQLALSQQQGLNQGNLQAQQNMIQQRGQDVQMQSNINNAGATIASENQKSQAGLLGGVLKSVGMSTELGKAHGGLITMADGGQVAGPRSMAGKHIHASKSQKTPVSGEMLAAKGKMVPGKAQVKGDSLKNDTVAAKLSPGEIVIPRSVVNAKDAPAAAADFVRAVLAKKGR